MLPNLKLILTTPPARVREALAFGLPVAYMAYRAGPGLGLLRSQLPVSVHGGLMMADDQGFNGEGNASVFCREVIQECTGRGFDAIILDFESPPSPPLGNLIADLGKLTARKGWYLYVPEAYASYSAKTKIILSSAISGGSLYQRLAEAVEKYGAGRVTLGLERMAEDFFLPAPTGRGRPLSREALKRQIAELKASVFFSRDLCASYFTYMSRQNGAHFVLFDDADSIRKKLLIASKLKIRDVILAYPQVDDLLPQVLSSI
jgi:hypothetical protein